MEPEVTPVEAEPEAELAEVEVKPGEKQKVNVGPILAAERTRIRTAEAEKHAKELEPLRAAAAERDALRADLAAVQPHIEHLKRHPELMKADEPPAIQQISDEEAEAKAREYELYTAKGLDLDRAKRIIAKENARMKDVATKAAAEAVRPVAERSALDQSRANFIAAVQQRSANGQPLVDPQILAQQWALVPAELSAQRDVAELILDRAIGAMHRQGKQPPVAPSHEPIFSETPGGPSPAYRISEIEKAVSRSAGINDKDWQSSAKKFVPGAINVIGE